MDKYNKIAREIIALIGEDNIISVTHCATRLRVMVKDRDLIDDKKMEKVDEVKGVFFTSGQYQIILGTGIVNKVYAEVENIGVKTLSKKEAMYAYEFEGRRYDVGDKLGFLEATVDFALKKPELKDSFMDYLKKVCKETNIEKEVALTEDSESKDKKVIK